MNDFFTNLVDRHLGTCDTIQPRTLSRFESDDGRVAAASPGEDTNPRVSEWGHTMEPRSGFSAEAPTVRLHESESVDEKKDHSFPPCLEQSDSVTNPDFTEQQTSFSVSHVFPGKLHNIQPSDTDRYSSQSEQRQRETNRTASINLEHTVFRDRDAQRSFTELNELECENNSERDLHVGEYYLENELDLRIRALLQRLVVDDMSPTTEAAHDDNNSQKNESLISPLSENKASSMDTVVASLLDTAPILEQQAGHQDKSFDDDRENTALNGWLQTPSWLSEIEAQFKQRFPEKEVNPEPVINVTIGRVEVRAVQSETPKNTQRGKKPTGVMTLDEYLKRREGKGTR